MRRLLRIVILGPIILVVLAMMLFVLPIVVFLDWLLTDKREESVWRSYTSLCSECFRGIIWG